MQNNTCIFVSSTIELLYFHQRPFAIWGNKRTFRNQCSTGYATSFPFSIKFEYQNRVFEGLISVINGHSLLREGKYATTKQSWFLISRAKLEHFIKLDARKSNGYSAGQHRSRPQVQNPECTEWLRRYWGVYLCNLTQYCWSIRPNQHRTMNGGCIS